MPSKFAYITNKCPKCGGKGYRWDGKRAFRGEGEEAMVDQCDCLKKMAYYQRLDAANIPREYFDLSLEAFKETTVEKAQAKEKTQAIIEDIDSYWEKGRGLYLYGNRGTGKTMLAIEILKGAINAGYSVHYDFYPVMFNDFQKKGYKADEVKAKYDEIIDKVDFLVLDEIAKEMDYLHTNTQDSSTISSRFLEMNILKKRASKPTILISNLGGGLEDMKKYYGQYVHSLMSHTYDLVKFEDSDFREGANR